MKTFLALFLLWAFVSSRLAFAENVGVASTAGASASFPVTDSGDSNKDGSPDDLSEEDSEESVELWEASSAEANPRVPTGSKVARALDATAKARAFKHFQERAVPDSSFRLTAEEKGLQARRIGQKAKRAAQVALQLQREAEARANLLENSGKDATEARRSVRAAIAEVTSAMDKTSEALLRSEALLERFRRDLAHVQGSVAFQNAAAEVALEKAKTVKRQARGSTDLISIGYELYAMTLQNTQNRSAIFAEGRRRLDKVTSLVLGGINRAEAAVETELKALIDQTYNIASRFIPKSNEEEP